MRHLILIITLFGSIFQCLAGNDSSLVSVRGTQFIRQGKPYYFIGTNFWYAPILASTGQGGNRERLSQELDSLQAMGINNLRILSGGDSGSDSANFVTPCLQTEPGVLNDTLLDGLDYLLHELEKRKMTCVIYLNNAWDWSGGYSFYLKHTGHGHSPVAEGEGYNNYVRFSANFSRSEKAQELFYAYVRSIVSRTNRYTGKPYKSSPAIMAWQICNEPRPFAKDEATKNGFARWILRTAAIIKEIDPNHLISTGSEGLYGCESDYQLLERIHSARNIDYLTIHLWPVNWRWADRNSLFQSMSNVFVKSEEYIDLHQRMAENINCPLVIEEFGYPRDKNFRSAGTPTDVRNTFYSYVFDKVIESSQKKGPIAGCNFWGWGGGGRQSDKRWKSGDDYLCDPPHEPQGWYSVFDVDISTISLIRKATRTINANQ